MTKFHDNILEVYDSATPAQLYQGKYWYESEYEIVRGYSCNHGDPSLIRAHLACLAICSPQQDWDRVKDSVYKWWSQGDHLGQVLNHAREKCMHIRRDIRSWPHYVRGLKTRSFAENLMSPFSSLAVTVDRHAVAIPFRGGALQTSINLTKPAHYERVAQWYRDVAVELGLLPHQVQAVTWVTWREREHSS